MAVAGRGRDRAADGQLVTSRPAVLINQRLTLPIQAFIREEVAGGIVLVAAAVIALLWANSPWGGAYDDLWATYVSFDLHFVEVKEDLGHFVNDGAMTLFFFVVGLEIKRELLRGELASRQRAALPAVAAFGGMVVPALLYVAVNAGGEGGAGWGIPMATDIAFALGVLALVGPRIPASLKVFLLALAIVDDLGAILVIAVFYTDNLAVEPLLWGALIVGGIVASRMVGVRSIFYYIIPGVLFWIAVLESGVHATLAGVVLALLTPASAMLSADQYRKALGEWMDRLTSAHARGDLGAEEEAIAQIGTLAEQREAPLDRLEHVLHPWTSFVVIPLFALANAGIDLSGDFFADAAGSSISLGIVLGLVGGKLLGVMAGCWLMVRLGLAPLPEGAGWLQMIGVSLLAGIGFTVSLFIADLAFDQEGLVAEAKGGIFAASIAAGVAGYAVLRWAAPATETRPAHPLP